MGIINPRPAIRRREARSIKDVLDRHDEIARHIMAESTPETRMSYQLASGFAYHIVRTHGKRKKKYGVGNDPRGTQNSACAMFHAASGREPTTGYAGPDQQDEGPRNADRDRANSFNASDGEVKLETKIAVMFVLRALTIMVFGRNNWLQRFWRMR